jgi:hypothetical protein
MSTLTPPQKSILNDEINITGLIKATQMETLHPVMKLDQGTRMFSAVKKKVKLSLYQAMEAHRVVRR